MRTCHLNLSPENIRAGKFNVCLEYHIKNCAGPCIGKQSQEEYLKNIAEIKEILKGNTQEIERMLFQQMQELAAEMKFEEAQKIKEKYLLLENYRAKSEVVSNVLHNIDVFSIEEDSDEKSAFVNYLHITNGAINQAFTFEYKKRLNESKEELLSLGIIEMRERYKSLSREIIVPFELDMELKDVVFTIPQRGDKKKLLELSILNVKQLQSRPPEASRKAESGATDRAPAERDTARAAPGPPAHADRMFRQLQHPGFRPRGRVRGLRQGETFQEGLPQVQYQDRRGTG